MNMRTRQQLLNQVPHQFSQWHRSQHLEDKNDTHTHECQRLFTQTHNSVSNLTLLIRSCHNWHNSFTTRVGL